VPTSSTRHDLDLGKQALAYASRGFLIFPLWHTIEGYGRPAAIRTRECACADGPDCGSPGKHPRTRQGLTEATSDERLVERWWAMWPHANIGLPAGGNGLAVIDIDPYHEGDDTMAVLTQYCQSEGVDLWATRTIRTGSGGTHLIYRQPAGGIISKSKAFGAAGVDTRGRGGYIVAPPSLHTSGDRYSVVENGHGIAPWPDPLTTLLNPAPAESGLPDGAIACGPRGTQLLAAQATGDRGAVWAFAALLGECKQLADMPLGEGNAKNAALNAAAYKLGRRAGGGFIDEASVSDALFTAVHHWIGHGHTDRELRATIRSGIRAGMMNPHPGPATRGGPR
jgi:hypothetical protein